MGKSYAEKVKAKQNKGSKTNRSRGRSVEKKNERHNKFPIAPVVVIVVLISLIITSIVLYQIQNYDNGNENPSNGNGEIDTPDDLPAYSKIGLESIDGGIISLDQYKGKVVIIDMFATWCVPCATQIGELTDLQSMFSGSEMVILSVDTDLRETKADVMEFMNDHPQADWTFALSGQEFNSNFPASSIPTLYILDKDLKIAHTEVGVTSAGTLEDKVEQLL
jgi:thiol-disulfide isomerase/thioredoxin